MKRIALLFIYITTCFSAFSQADSTFTDSVKVKPFKKHSYPDGFGVSFGPVLANVTGFKVQSLFLMGEANQKIGYSVSYTSISVKDTAQKDKPLKTLGIGVTSRLYATKAGMYLTGTASLLFPVSDKDFKTNWGMSYFFGGGFYDFGSKGVDFFVEFGPNFMIMNTNYGFRPEQTAFSVNVGFILN